MLSLRPRTPILGLTTFDMRSAWVSELTLLTQFTSTFVRHVEISCGALTSATHPPQRI
ncbi:hypothetical protein X777_06755 [Ooceraea biroi]|uniref:Uncharacterized protein n=1 Tax=Ooceraea biroi TaxID=2015173 RepID=A0A026X3V6_OOCBI|nr:hypothetical protein X777_06755 [Ooceraea biroi]